MIKKLFLHPTDSLDVQFIRYGVVVAVAFPVDFGLLYVFTSRLHIYYVLSATLSFTISLIVNYILSVSWVFQSRFGQSRRREAAVFAVIGFIGLGLTDALIWLLTTEFKLYYLISKLVAAVVVFFWSFGARRYLFHGGLRASSTAGS